MFDIWDYILTGNQEQEVIYNFPQTIICNHCSRHFASGTGYNNNYCSPECFQIDQLIGE